MVPRLFYRTLSRFATNRAARFIMRSWRCFVRSMATSGGSST